MLRTEGLPMNPPNLEAIRSYWDEHIHDLEVATAEVGSPEFFQQLDHYRYEKLDYLARVIDFASYRGKRLLEVGCGAGIDLVRFARAGAEVTGVDLAPVSIELARRNFEQRDLEAELLVMNGEDLRFDKDTFDVVYAHGVLQYTADAQQMISEIYRVLKPGGEAIMMVYNRRSWLNALSNVMGVELEHEDAPVLRKYTIGEFREMLDMFSTVHILPERFPVKTRLHKGFKARAYNDIFVPMFQLIPRQMTRSTGWHLMAFAYKQ